MSRLSLAQRRQALLESVQARGFDRSRIDTSFGTPAVHVACSQCDARSICGVACHETGCPNQTGECDDCGAPVPRRQRLCDACYQQQTEELEDLESGEPS